MGGEVVARTAFGYEGAQLDIFNRYLFDADLAAQYVGELGVVEFATRSEGRNLVLAKFVEMAVEGFDHADKGDFGGVWDKRKHGGVEARADRIVGRGNDVGTEGLTFAIDFGIAAA